MFGNLEEGGLLGCELGKVVWVREECGKGI